MALDEDGHVMEADPEDIQRLGLEQRLRAAEDRLELLDLEGAYGRAYDSRQGEVWSALFVEDGIYQGRQLAGMAAQNFVQGRTALARFCEREPLSGIHMMHMPQLTIDGDEARGRVHFQFQATGVDDHGRSLARAVTGYYDVAYTRTAEGWRIRRRVTTYLESTQRTVYRYEPTPADLDASPPAAAAGGYQDSRP